MKIDVRWNPKNKFCVARIHYKHDPEKDNPEWIAKAKEGISEAGWNREYEIAYDVFAGLPVYSAFAYSTHVIDDTALVVKPGSVLYRGWDFGYNHPAMVVAYINEFDQFIVIDEILGDHEGIKEFGMRCKRYCDITYPGVQWFDACDDAGKQASDKSPNETSIQILNNYPINIYPVFRQSGINEGLELIRQRLTMRSDGKYGMLFKRKCNILIDAFKGGYRYPERKSGVDTEKEMPLKDGYYEHLCDALRELMINCLELSSVSNNPSELTSSNNDIMYNRGGGINEYL